MVTGASLAAAPGGLVSLTTLTASPFTHSWQARARLTTGSWWTL